MRVKDLHNPLYNLLTERRFRLYRHLFLVVYVGILLSNHLFITYVEQLEFLNMYVIISVYIVVYLSVVYLNLYLFIPRLLFREKYIEYGLVLSGAAFFLLVGDFAAEAFIHDFYQIPFGRYSFYSSGRSQVLEFCSGFFLFVLYLISISLAVFYRHWLSVIQREEYLLTEQVHAELDSFKSRISSSFLLRKLRKAADCCGSNPLKSSRILLQLCRILRYQLYDCGRESVLLSSEVKFLTDYLKLEKLCNSRFDFEIHFAETTAVTFVQPMLFIPFVEASLHQLSRQEDEIRIDIDFIMRHGRLFFSCMDNRCMPATPETDSGIPAIVKRLEFLENKSYTLSTTEDMDLSRYKVVFEYNL